MCLFFAASGIVLNDISQRKNKVCLLTKWDIMKMEQKRMRIEYICMVMWMDVYMRIPPYTSGFIFVSFSFCFSNTFRQLVQSALSCNMKWITDQRTANKSLGMWIGQSETKATGKTKSQRWKYITNWNGMKNELQFSVSSKLSEIAGGTALLIKLCDIAFSFQVRLNFRLNSRCNHLNASTLNWIKILLIV